MLHDVFCFANSTNTGFVTGEVRWAELLEKGTTAPRPLVVILHGVRGFARWGMFPSVAETLANAGAIALTVNFSLNGVSRALTDDELERKDLSALEDFSELERFAQNTIRQECDDARMLLAKLRDKTLFHADEQVRHDQEHPLSAAWNGDVYVLAHSRGGAVAWIVAAENGQTGENEQKNVAVKRIVAWCTVGALDRFTARQKEEWHAQGFLASPNARTGQMMSQNIGYLLDLEANSDRYEPMNAIQRVRVPVCLIHGEQDMTVPHKHSLALAERLQASGNTACEVHIVPNTGHTFGAVHPFAGSTAALDTALAITARFFGLSALSAL
jgi:uncharacterized protein